MKQFKLWMVALTILMGASLTSCLNSEDNYDDTQRLFVRVQSMMGSHYFVDAAGNKLMPTYASLLQVEASNSDFKIASTNFAFITFKTVEVEEKSRAGDTPESYDINLLSAITCDGPTSVIVENSEEMESQIVENAPIYSLIRDGYFLPYIHDKETLYLPIHYKMENKVDQVKQHKFILCCNVEDMTSSDLVFYLRHDRGTDEKTETGNIANNGYDITEAVMRFSEMNDGAEPQNIIIKVKEVGEFSSSSQVPEEYTVYSGEFKAGRYITKN